MQLNLEYLRVLSLEGYRALKIVPNSIGEFIHLRYLDLSDTEIVSLPNSLCKLYNLQTLRLRYCFRLKMMPSDMQDLVNLRHLDIAYTYLKEMPKGLSKLKDLQFLSDFIIGKDHGTMIGELGECSHLQEGIHIANLENVNNSNEAYMAKMMEKKHIKDLRLSWSSEECINDSKTERDILDKLQPHWDLECLHINGYRGTSFPEWLGSFSYQNMTDLKLRDCRSCWMLPPLGQLPALKRLSIYRLDRVVNIGAEFSKGDYYASVVPFASLESLWFKNMFAWKEWHSIEMEAFPKLRELTIYDCPKFTGDLPHQLLSLETLKIKKCPLLASSMPKYPAIQYLQLLRSEKVELQELSLSLQSLTISGCRQMESMFKAMGDFEYSYLEDLQLNECSSAISVPVIYMPPSMKKLRIYNCKLLELPDHQRHMSIESLSVIKSCDALASFPAGIFPCLKKLCIKECENLSSVLVSNTPLQNLQNISIADCKNLKCLSNDTETLLPNLKELCIKQCPEIEPFPEAFFPSSLRYLEIVNCDKQFGRRTEWHLPSLTFLHITSKDDCVKCFPEEGLLPTTLTDLVLDGFSSLETLDCKGLRHLTSLQKLKIERCHKLERLAGEMLPASLIKLDIWKCDLLQVRCRKKDGEIWPRISHIPSIYLTYDIIS